MSYIIDRRLNGKNKSTLNRQRFIRRYKKQIKEAVSDAINKRSVTDTTSGESISIPQRDISEPIFHQGRGGDREQIHPGNDQFSTGDKIKRPQGGGQGGGSGEGEASDSGEGQDDFVFSISKERNGCRMPLSTKIMLFLPLILIPADLKAIFLTSHQLFFFKRKREKEIGL